MDQVSYALAGAVSAYSAKSALFTAGYADQGTWFDSTGSYTITLDPTSMVAGWSAWFRSISGTQTFDPSGSVTINGAGTYAVSNAGDVVLVEFDGTNFVISQTQLPAAVKITGGTIDGTAIGGTVAAAGAFTTGSFTGAVSLTSASSGLTISKTTTTVLTIASTNAASVTTAGGYTSTVATGTAPFTATSTTVCPNLNASLLLGSTWAIPGSIGATTPAAGAFTTLAASSFTSLSVRLSFVANGSFPGSGVAGIYRDASLGLTFAGFTSSTNSWTFLNNSGGTVLENPIGTTKVNFLGTTDVAMAGTASVVFAGGIFVTKGVYAAYIGAATAAGSGGEMFTLSPDGTLASPSATTARQIGAYNFYGYGTGIVAGGGIRCFADETWSGSARGCRIEMYTTAVGATANTKQVTIDNAGVVTVHGATASTSTTTGALIVTGGIGCAGQITFDGNSGSSLRVTNGTANAAVATVLGSVGPTGSQTTVQGWLRISVAGTDRYIPFW